jgi:hypothetical protein
MLCPPGRVLDAHVKVVSPSPYAIHVPSSSCSHHLSLLSIFIFPGTSAQLQVQRLTIIRYMRAHRAAHNSRADGVSTSTASCTHCRGCHSSSTTCPSDRSLTSISQPCRHLPQTNSAYVPLLDQPRCVERLASQGTYSHPVSITETSANGSMALPSSPSCDRGATRGVRL